MRIITAATASPDMYSILPCPNGCSLSGFMPANLNPIRVISDDPASDKLLNASAIIAIEPHRKPVRYFPAKRQRFKPIPTTLQSDP